MATTHGTTSGKAGYHHGDLRNALIAAAVDLATEGGPEKVVLREAARRVGVSPTAAYRHFEGQGDLLHAVKIHGQLALVEWMERASAAVPRCEDPGDAAESRIAAMGRGYVGFALAEPGLYRAAFCNPKLPGGSDEDEEWAGLTPAGPGPEFGAFVLLTAALDALVATGRMPESNRAAAEVAAWSAVHGLSMLILDGPLKRLPLEERDAVIDRTVATITAGLTAPRSAVHGSGPDAPAGAPAE
ncbi:TetR/AcrR family transcriptional regulator [Streptomyces sp. NPDC059909]|uniref:TetR/AcrR family transcriptional regulator n=1 Tax=Streptomyces sp. NPDC059909 TaxID=3346998 RepID=UPI00365F4B61